MMKARFQYSALVMTAELSQHQISAAAAISRNTLLKAVQVSTIHTSMCITKKQAIMILYLPQMQSLTPGFIQPSNMSCITPADTMAQVITRTYGWNSRSGMATSRDITGTAKL